MEKPKSNLLMEVYYFGLTDMVIAMYSSKTPTELTDMAYEKVGQLAKEFGFESLEQFDKEG
jgi:hypothetical protein